MPDFFVIAKSGDKGLAFPVYVVLSAVLAKLVTELCCRRIVRLRRPLEPLDGVVIAFSRRISELELREAPKPNQPVGNLGHR